MAKSYTPTTTGTPLERFVGSIAGGVFSACYYYAVLWLPTVLVLYLCGWRTTALLLTVPYVASTVLPVKACPRLLSTWFFKCVLKLHDYEEINEMSVDELKEIEKTRKLIFAVVPHGVMSICGICMAVGKAPEATPPTCAASVIHRIPILKHVFGAFGIMGASSASITAALKKTSVAMYPGGIAELFLSTPREERLYVSQRKGFIKLALRTGSDVVPCYYFGNTVVLEIIRHAALTSISRKLGVSITMLWGRWGLPIPAPCKVLCVSGKALGLPKREFPTDEEVDKWHAVYMDEVKRLFNTYKGRTKDYAEKELFLE